jgi:peptidoglycan/xylan/chitin deacetylase (PgdA/CDA1 family)
MKYLLASSVLLVSLLAAIFMYNGSFRFPGSSAMLWESRESKTARSRLLEIPILLYHNIDGSGPYSVNSETLRRHFEILREDNIKVIPLKELDKRIDNQRQTGEKLIVLTFDDGYPSMYTKLLPLAKEFNYPVTLFIYTDFIHSAPQTLLNWKTLIEMDSQLIDIQSHSLSHDNLSGLSAKNGAVERKKLFDEIYLSKRLLETYLRKKINFFAFPYGEYSHELLELCEKAGYKRVLSTEYGANIITADNFCLRRHHIKSDYSIERFKSIVQNLP